MFGCVGVCLGVNFAFGVWVSCLDVLYFSFLVGQREEDVFMIQNCGEDWVDLQLKDLENTN